MMRSSSAFHEELFDFYASLWSVVTRLTPEDCRRLYTSFLSICVRTDYARKFGVAFSGRKPLTDRFFRSFHAGSLSDGVGTLFARACPERITVRILLGSVELPFGMILQGAPRQMDSIFVVEEDSIVQIEFSKTRGYACLDGQRGHLRIFRQDSRLSRME